MEMSEKCEYYSKQHVEAIDEWAREFGYAIIHPKAYLIITSRYIEYEEDVINNFLKDMEYACDIKYIDKNKVLADDNKYVFLLEEYYENDKEWKRKYLNVEKFEDFFNDVHSKWCYTPITVKHLLTPLKEEIESAIEQFGDRVHPFCDDPDDEFATRAKNWEVCINGNYYDVHDYHFGVEGDGTLVLEINDINGCIDKDVLK